MSIITRSEAEFRLKKLAAMANSAVTHCRGGRWRDCFDDLYSLEDEAKILLTHVEEAMDDQIANGGQRDLGFVDADNLSGSLQYGTPPPPKQRIGGMGYRGSSHSRKAGSDFVPLSSRVSSEPRPDPKPDWNYNRPRPDAYRPQADPVWNPLNDIIGDISAAIKARGPQPEPSPIITPEPAKEIPVTRFDLARIPGTQEFIEAFTGDIAPLTPEETQTAEIFARLTDTVRDKIIARYRDTRKPVGVKLSESAFVSTV